MSRGLRSPCVSTFSTPCPRGPHDAVGPGHTKTAPPCWGSVLHWSQEGPGVSGVDVRPEGIVVGESGVPSRGGGMGPLQKAHDAGTEG